MSPSPSFSPSFSPSPWPSFSPSPSYSPAYSPDPDPSPNPDPSPEPSNSPAPSSSPEPSESPVPSESPIPSESPEPSDSPEPSSSPDPSPQPSPEPSPIPETFCEECVNGQIITIPATPTCPAGETSSEDNSVLLASGQFVFRLPLLSISAIGVGSWGFGLDYLPGNGIDGLLGKSFNFTQNLHLAQAAGGIELVSGRNTRSLFAYDALTGTYSSDANVTAATLVLANAGTAAEEFVLTARGGNITRFFGFHSAIATPGRIKSITDRFGSSQSFAWSLVNGVMQLQSVTDAYGRTIAYRYYGAEKGHRLCEIEDFLGRKLNFQYDDNGHLAAVVTPSIFKGAEGNTFPGGTAYVFQYDTANPDPERCDDLIRIWYPNQVTAFIDTAARTVDVAAVYAQATPRYFIEYGPDGRVIRETVGDPANGVGGTYHYAYTTAGLPANPIDPADPIVARTIMTDRNGNEKVYDFNQAGMAVRVEVRANRGKSSLQASSYVTWTKFNASNQPVLVVHPEGNSEEMEYEDGTGLYARRKGLLLRRTRRPGNSLGLPSRSGSNGQSELTQRYFYDPLFNKPCAVIEERGNSISGSAYFTPQNGGTTPTDADRSRYATITYFDYQKDVPAAVQNDAKTQARLGLSAVEIGSLIVHVNQQMIAGGLPDGFQMSMGDINGDGTGFGTGNSAKHLGNAVKVKHPSVRLVDGTVQERMELFTSNDRGQTTTRTDPEGNLTVYVRYPENDPEGDGQHVSPTLSGQQYGHLKETHVDADPAEVMTLIGADGDLVTFIPGKITRTNTPGVYQDLITRHASAAGCASCGYDALGNGTSTTDARGFTTTYDRNEMGEVFRVNAPLPYGFRVETHYDANRNVVRVDTEDKVVHYASEDPTSADYAKFTPSGSGSTANPPMKAGPGGSVRLGWFTNLMRYDLLDNRIEQDIDAAGSTPASLVTTFAYDGNQNLVKITKPMGNTVDYDYDERNLRIAQRVGYDPAVGEAGAVTVWTYDKNGSLLHVLGPADRTGEPGTRLSVTIENAFGSEQAMAHTGDWLSESTYDGFGRLIKTTDAIGNTAEQKHDPAGRAIEVLQRGPIGGISPIDRNGVGNVDLAKTIVRFDEAGRAYKKQREVFVGAGLTLPSGRSVTHTGGGLAANSTANDHTATITLVNAGAATAQSSYVLSCAEYDRSGRAVKKIADNTAQTIYSYDGAGRNSSVTDALGNRIEYTYDGNGNVISVTRTEKCTITTPSVSDEVFRSAMRHDYRNRLVVSAEQGADGSLSSDLSDGQTLFTLYGYDSRGNRTNVIDPKKNTQVTVFDGAGRAIERHQHMRIDGEGFNGPEANESFLSGGRAAVVTKTTFDANGRVTKLVDDRGGTTSYRYDSLDRQKKMSFHDGASRTSVYNAASDMSQFTDENGSVFSYASDAMGRRSVVSITPASGVVGTTAQSFEYDGLGRMTRAVDTVGSTSAEARFVFDSMGRVIEESQSYGGNTRNVTYHAFTSTPASGFTFPQGRQLTNAHDALGRRTQVAESGGSSIAAWEFFGSSRVAEAMLGNGLICTWMNNARTHAAVQAGVANPAWGDASSDRLGYDGSGRMIAKRYLNATAGGGYSSTASVVGFTTAYDRASNKLFERHLHAENRSFLYPAHDSMNRLREYQRGTLASGGTSLGLLITLPGTDAVRSYDLDDLGNWSGTTYTPTGGSSATEVRQHNLLNQVTAVDSTGLTHDANGNLTDDGARLCYYDALNRLKKVFGKGDGLQVAEYVYDALGRRIRKAVSNGGLDGSIPNGTTDCLYDGHQCVEERNGSNAATKQFVWGLYIDELIQQRNLVAINGLSGDLYPMQDLLYRTAGLSDSGKAVREAYDCDAYGNTLIFRNAGSPPAAIAFGDADTQVSYPTCDCIFTGRQYDPETHIYFYRARYYQPTLGRFMQRDPLGPADGMGLYGYVGTSPLYYTDPYGTKRFTVSGKSEVEVHTTYLFWRVVPKTFEVRRSLRKVKTSWDWQFEYECDDATAKITVHNATASNFEMDGLDNFSGAVLVVGNKLETWVEPRTSVSTLECPEGTVGEAARVRVEFHIRQRETLYPAAGLWKLSIDLDWLKKWTVRDEDWFPNDPDDPKHRKEMEHGELSRSRVMMHMVGDDKAITRDVSCCCDPAELKKTAK